MALPFAGGGEVCGGSRPTQICSIRWNSLLRTSPCSFALGGFASLCVLVHAPLSPATLLLVVLLSSWGAAGVRSVYSISYVLSIDPHTPSEALTREAESSILTAAAAAASF